MCPLSQAVISHFGTCSFMKYWNSAVSMVDNKMSASKYQLVRTGLHKVPDSVNCRVEFESQVLVDSCIIEFENQFW